jgi:hypothetical protein
MSLVRAPELGIERFANDANRKHWSNASAADKNTIIRAVYQQVLASSICWPANGSVVPNRCSVTAI